MFWPSPDAPRSRITPRQANPDASRRPNGEQQLEVALALYNGGP